MYLVHPEIPVEIFHVGPLSIRWYSLMYIFGFLFWFWWTQNEVKHHRIYIAKSRDYKVGIEYLSEFLSYSMIGIVLCGRLGYVLLYKPQYYFTEDFWAIFRPWEGGMSFHGAFLGTYLAAWIWMNHFKEKRQPFTLLDFSDIVLVPVPLGLAFGRIGNFINGELFGRPTSMPWGMLFPYRQELGHFGADLLPIDTVQSILDKTQMVLQDNITQFLINGQVYVQIPRHPSQLYHFFLEGLTTFTIQMFLYYKVPQSKYRGFLTGTFLICYGCSRIFTEFFRQPDLHIGFVAFNWVTIGMLYSLPMVIVGIGIVIWSLQKQYANLTRVR